METDWKYFFETYRDLETDRECAYSFVTTEEMYQAFKARMLEEMAEENE